MPGTRSAVKGSAVGEGSVMEKVTVKLEAKACQEMEQDLEKLCGEGASDVKSIFSVCQTHDDMAEDASTELAHYELNYLHSLYQTNDGDFDDDAILPDAVAPPSLGAVTDHMDLASAGNASCKAPDSSTSISSPFSQPDTPPRGSPVSSEVEPSPRGAGSAPRGPGGKASSKASANRKRKAPGSEPGHPSKAETSRQNKGPSQEPAAVEPDSEDEDDGPDSPCPSNKRMFDGLEVRPEDDPLGLFSKDPATLTPEEQRLLKKQRRLLKNRESAQLSRHRKKMQVSSLERQVESLKKEKAMMTLRVQELTDENERLRKQLVAIA